MTIPSPAGAGFGMAMDMTFMTIYDPYDQIRNLA